MKKKTLFAVAVGLIAAASITSCGSAETTEETTTEAEVVTEEVAEEPAEEPAEEAAEAISGEELYTKTGCVACHQPDAKTVGPSIKSIAEAYKDNQEGLVNFMNGEGEAIVDPDQAAVMQPQVEITKAMTDEERAAIAEYILSI